MAIFLAIIDTMVWLYCSLHTNQTVSNIVFGSPVKLSYKRQLLVFMTSTVSRKQMRFRKFSPNFIRFSINIYLSQRLSAVFYLNHKASSAFIDCC